MLCGWHVTAPCTEGTVRVAGGETWWTAAWERVKQNRVPLTEPASSKGGQKIPTGSDVSGSGVLIRGRDALVGCCVRRGPLRKRRSVDQTVGRDAMRACRCGTAWTRLKARSLGADLCDDGARPRTKCEKLRTSADRSGVRLDGPWCELLGGWAVEQIKGEFHKHVQGM
nr:hypothetical protein Iba_chr01bCG3630 [Ipomoea batatas]